MAGSATTLRNYTSFADSFELVPTVNAGTFQSVMAGKETVRVSLVGRKTTSGELYEPQINKLPLSYSSQGLGPNVGQATLL